MKKSLLLVVLALSLLTSCNTELKLAKRFVEENQNVAVAVLFPEAAQVKVEHNATYNKKTEVMDGFSQDLFLDVVYNSYAEGLRAYGLDVYIPEDVENIRMDSVHWYVMLSQMEIVGRITQYVDYLFSDRDDYSYKFPLNEINVASWFDVNNGEWLPVLFNETSLIDKFESKVDYHFWKADFDYQYTIDTLKLEDVYNFGVYLGKQYAGYTFNALMNKFVEKEMLNQYYMLPSQYVKYDPYRKEFLYDVNDDRFRDVN